MIKAAEIIFLKQKLTDILNQISLSSVVSEKTSLFESITDLNFEFEKNQFDRILSLNNNVLDSLNQKINSLDDILVNLHESLLSNPEYLEKFTNKNINFGLEYDELTEHLVTRKTGFYADWKYPGLILNSQFRGGEYQYEEIKHRIDPLVSLDPLYFAGPDLGILEGYISFYSELYQSRVRKYEVKDLDFSILPQKQFGFVLCWDFINHLNFNLIKDYVTHIYPLLRTGGVLMFSFTDCELLETAHQYDDGYIPYCTKKLIRNLLESSGYEIIQFNHLKNDNNWISWVEAKVPGRLSTVKRRQVLGSIQQK